MMKKVAPARVRVKNADLGEVEAVFATLNVIDKDGDVILPGAITDGAAVTVSAYGHKTWSGELPTGAGTIHEVGDELIARVKFFLDTDQGRNTFGAVKGLAEHGLGEWSWSLQDVEAQRGTWKGQKANLISKVGLTAEVSPVLLGAGVNTRTLAVKGAKQLNSEVSQQLRALGRERWGDDVYVWVADFDLDAGFAIFEIDDPESMRLVQVSFDRDDDVITLADDEVDVERRVVYAPKSGRKFAEHLKSVLADVEALTARAEEVMALRAAKGKSLSDDTVERLAGIGDQLDRLKRLLPEPNDIDDTDITGEYLRFVAFSQGVKP
jgi:hypothetical protein